MKKELKNHKTHYARFFLLVISILLSVNWMFAQCPVNAPGCSCQNDLTVDRNCNTSCSAYATDVTDIKAIVKNTDLVNIKAANFTTQVRMFASNFSISSPTLGSFQAATVADLPANFTSKEGVTFADAPMSNNPQETITGSGTYPDPGTVICFTVTATDDKGTSVSRKWSLTIDGSPHMVGDPHIITVDGRTYDFQSAGEFVALRDSLGTLEIQTRQTPVSTNGPGSASNNTADLTTCVSLNTAVAVRVGTHRVTYEPNVNGVPDPSGLQLRVDGVLTNLDENGLDLGSGGRVTKSPAGGGIIVIDFPGGTSLTVTPGFWTAFSVWYLNLEVSNALARKGLMGVIPQRSWLPALPDGSSMGSKPDGTHQRFVALYQKFADAWRVTDSTSLFDYAPGKSTASFTNKAWPAENANSCGIQGQTPLTPIALNVAQNLARDIVDLNLRTDAILDVMVTGDSIFAKTYLLAQRAKTGPTATRLSISRDTSNTGEAVTFTATVVRKSSAEKGLAGTIEFTVDGTKLQDANLDANGQATITTTALAEGQHKIAAKFTPDAGSKAFASSSLDVSHTVIGGGGGGGGTAIFHHWWFWLILILLLLILILALRKKKP